MGSRALPDDIEPADFPAWLLDELEALTPQPQPAPPPNHASPAGLSDYDRAKKYLDTCEPLHPEPDHPQDASSQLFKLAGKLVVGFALDIDVSAQRLYDFDRQGSKVFPLKECKRKCEEAWKHRKEEVGYLLKKPEDAVKPHAPPLNGNAAPKPEKTASEKAKDALHQQQQQQLKRRRRLRWLRRHRRQRSKRPSGPVRCRVSRWRP